MDNLCENDDDDYDYDDNGTALDEMLKVGDLCKLVDIVKKFSFWKCKRYSPPI